MGRLDVRHHVFIQSLMSKGPVSDSDAKSMFRELCHEGGVEFTQFVSAINKEMNFLQMEIRVGTNQYDGQIYYGLVNKLGNEQAKLGTRYSHSQIAFFKSVLEAIISGTSLNGKISTIQALNLRLDNQNEQQSTAEISSQAPALNMTLAQKEKTLEELAHDRWLNLSPDGMVGLGIRSFLELWNVFKNYDVPVCDVCNEAGIKAQACQNEDCSVRMHDYCLTKRFHSRQVARVCPKCGTDWNSSDDAPQRVRELNSSPQHSQGVFPVISPRAKGPCTRRHRRGEEYAVSLA